MGRGDGGKFSRCRIYNMGMCSCGIIWVVGVIAGYLLFDP